MRAGSLVAVLLIAMTLAGCSSGSEGGENTPAPSTTSGPGATSGTPAPTSGTPTTAPPTTSPGTTSGQPENHEPSATLSAAPKPGNLTVEFSVKATDADQDALTWSLDANGDGKGDKDGKTVPATVSYTYSAAGSFNATLTVSDGKAETKATAKVTVTAPGGGPGGPAGNPQSFSGEWVNGAFACGGIRPTGAGSIYEGVMLAVMEVTPNTVGQSFKATFESAAEQLEVIVEFRDGDFALVGEAIRAQAAPWELTGKVPLGAAYGVFLSCAPAGGSVEYTTPI